MSTVPVRLTDKTVRVSFRQIEYLRKLAQRPYTARELNFATLRSLWRRGLIDRQPSRNVYQNALWTINAAGLQVLEQTGGLDD